MVAGCRKWVAGEQQNHFMMQDYSKSRLGAAHRAQTDHTSVIFVIPDQEFILSFLHDGRALYSPIKTFFFCCGLVTSGPGLMPFSMLNIKVHQRVTSVCVINSVFVGFKSES